MILLHHTHCDQFIIPSSRLAGFWIFRQGVNLKTKGSNSDKLQFSNSTESRFALGVSSKGISLLSQVLSFLQRIYINSQINLFSKLRSCPQPAQSSQITWVTSFALEDTCWLLYMIFLYRHHLRRKASLSGKHTCTSYEQRSWKASVNILSKPYTRYDQSKEGQGLMKNNSVMPAVFLPPHVATSLWFLQSLTCNESPMK